MAEAESDRLKLMVVDDEADNLDLLYRTFRRDFIVYKATSGLNALDVLEQAGEMSIIISDQRMPQMNGTEFLSRTVSRFPDTIRILLTGYTDAEDLVGAINAGKVFKYVTKPWTPEHLKAIVKQAAETYQVVKQRTNELHRALRRESLFNTVTTAIRESLDYCSMLQTVVETIGHTFAADTCTLHPIESLQNAPAAQHLAEKYIYLATPAPAAGKPTAETNGFSPHPLFLSPPDTSAAVLNTCLETRTIQLLQAQEPDYAHTQLIVPLTYQQETLAVLTLYKHGSTHPWSADEIHLITGVAEQAALAISQAKLYQRTQIQTEQMRAELAIARQIQMNLLRQSLPQLESVRVQAHCYPAREVGGDFFEVYVHSQGDVWLAVGDVSGKGVPAALFMASAISLLRRELSADSPEPDSVMRRLNRSLSDDLVGSNCFITMVLARFTPATYELVYANAGHIYPMVWSSGAQADDRLEPTYLKVRGVPLGILPDWRASAGSLILKSGDTLLLTSDGITEATVNTVDVASSSHKPMLQQAGLWQLLRQQRDALDLDRLMTQIQAASQIQEDDQTILSLEVL